MRRAISRFVVGGSIPSTLYRRSSSGVMVSVVDDSERATLFIERQYRQPEVRAAGVKADELMTTGCVVR